MTGIDVTRPQVTGSNPEVTPFDRNLLEVTVEGQKLAYTVHFTSSKAVAGRRRQSRDSKCRNVTSGD